MSEENKLWMGNIEKWMDEKVITKFFNEYNFIPKKIELLPNKKGEDSINFCYIYFNTLYEANEALTKLNGKYIPNTNLTFKLNWAKPNSENIDIYVGNLSPEINNLDLYNLFKEKYSSVHHALIITDKKSNISKGYGFINFLKKEEATKCIEEMNGYFFYNKSLILKEKNNKTRDNNKKSNNKNKTEINSEDEEKRK